MDSSPLENPSSRRTFALLEAFSRRLLLNALYKKTPASHKIQAGFAKLREDAVMALALKSAGILRMLIYPIQFDAEPVEGIDRVLKMVVFADHLKLQVPDVIAAIDAGLDSNASLSELVPQTHTEAVIRSYLAAVRIRLVSETPGARP